MVAAAGFLALLLVHMLHSSSCSMLEQLRNKGKLHLLKGKYDEAADCYAAVLQSLEGTGGDEVGELMRRCGLTLAECEIKLGNLYDAVARCSEVIDDTPHSDSSPSTRHTLAKAFYRRGVAFFRLNMSEFSYMDMRKAAEYAINDTKISKYVTKLKPTVASSNITQIEDQLQDTIEEALSHFPRRVFDEDELVQMLDGFKARRSKRKSPVTESWLDVNIPSESVGFEEMTQTIEGGLPFGLGNFGELSGLGGVLTNVFEPGNIQNYMEIFSAVRSVFNQVKSILTYLRTHQNLVLWIMSALWLVRITLT